MNISGIKDSVVSAVSAGITATGNFVSWCGYKVSSGFNNYLVPAIQAVWSKIAPAAQKSVNFMRTGYGFGAGLATIGVAGLVATWWPKTGAQACSNVDSKKIAFTVASVTAIVGAAAVSYFIGGARVV